MKIFYSVFGISIAVFFLFLLPMVYSWIFYLSSTIHKNFMFLLCNGLLVFIRLNSRSICKFSTGKCYGVEQIGTNGDEQQQVAESFESRPSYGSRTVAQVEYEKEAGNGSLYGVEVTENRFMIEEDEEKKVHQTFSVIVEDIQVDYLAEVAEDYKSLSVEETPYNELQEQEEKVEQEQEQEQAEEVEDQEQAEEGGTDMISLEELNKKCEEFIRRIREEMRYESQTIACY